MEGERSGAPVGFHEVFGFGGRGILGGYSGVMGAPSSWSHIDRMLIRVFVGVSVGPGCWWSFRISSHCCFLLVGVVFGSNPKNNCFLPMSLEPLL